MIYDKSFVITAFTPWGAFPSGSAERLAAELSRTNRVLYVNPPASLAALLRGGDSADACRKNRVLRGSEPAIRRAGANLWILEPPIVVPRGARIYSDTVFDLLNRYNNRRYADVIGWAMKHTGIDDFYLLIDNDTLRSFYLPELLAPDLAIYYRSRNLAAIPYWSYHAGRLEPRLVSACDMVAASSESLAEDVRGYNFNTFNIDQGVDLRGYDAGAYHHTPQDMLDIPHPIAGLAGILSTMYYDPDLIGSLAGALPGCSVVLVGGEDGDFSRHALHKRPNVFFLGAKSARELPAYVAGFDVCINPEAINDYTRDTFRPFIVQSLAMGKNVVSTRSQPAGRFVNHILLASDAAQFAAMTSRSLMARPAPEVRRSRADFARSFSWSACAERLCASIEMVEEELCGKECAMSTAPLFYS